MTKEKEKGFFIIKMVKNMKENGRIIKGKEKEYINIKMVIDMKENGKMIK